MGLGASTSLMPATNASTALAALCCSSHTDTSFSTRYGSGDGEISIETFSGSAELRLE